jgi:hypothetical protein
VGFKGLILKCLASNMISGTLTDKMTDSGVFRVQVSTGFYRALFRIWLESRVTTFEPNINITIIMDWTA